MSDLKSQVSQLTAQLETLTHEVKYLRKQLEPYYLSKLIVDATPIPDYTHEDEDEEGYPGKHKVHDHIMEIVYTCMKMPLGKERIRAALREPEYAEGESDSDNSEETDSGMEDACVQSATTEISELSM